MSTKINFTAEHKQKMSQLLVKVLLSGTVVKGNLGAEYNAHQLVNDLTINTLQQMNTNLRRIIDSQQSLDEWSQTDSQQKALAVVKETQELINLIIGYKKAEAQKTNDRQKLSQLKAERKRLEESTMTPEDKLKALDQAIADIGDVEEN